MSLAALAEAPARCQVLHRDLKPENGASATLRDSMSCWLTSFSLLVRRLCQAWRLRSQQGHGHKRLHQHLCRSESVDVPDIRWSTNYLQTPLYMPPEILGENRYDTKSDIWSLGCLVYELCALE